MSRSLFALLTIAFAAVSAGAFGTTARAQTYAPGYPVCMQVYGPINYFDCRYSSIAQCNLSASGRAAQCVRNPYAESAEVAGPRRRRAY